MLFNGQENGDKHSFTQIHISSRISCVLRESRDKSQSHTQPLLRTRVSLSHTASLEGVGHLTIVLQSDLCAIAHQPLPPALVMRRP